MLRRTVRLALLCLAVAGLVLSQGINTTASPDDWEEINFEFDSDILVDGFPSLLRLADLLNQNPDYRVALVGHADYLGSDQYNDDLAMRRGNAVGEFLQKYGARADQITVSGRGEQDPRINAQTDEARFMNRRVQMTVTDGQGRIVSAGGVGDAIDALEQLAQQQEDCCNAILGELTKLDQILAALEDLKNDNAALRDELAALRDAQSGLEQKVASAPPAPTEEQMASVARTAAREAVGPEMPVFSVLGFNVGTDNDGDVTFSGRGRFFKPLNSIVAFQSEAEFMSWSGRKEGQFDFGLVGRPVSEFQLGGFASFRHVNFSQFQQGGTLGQASLTADYLFTRGRVGLFGAKGFMQSALLNSRNISNNVIENTYARTVDQLGASAAVGLWDDAWIEGNIGYLKTRTDSDSAGGGARLVVPFTEHWAFTAEGGVNETLVTPDTYGRWAVGLQLGNFLGPKRYMEVDHPVPADIPRVRYELVTERVRTGNDAPVADAGPDLIGIPAGPVTLDGSASYDPDEDPITFRWTQVAGPTVSLSGADTAVATFTAIAGASYGFRLEVADDQGGKGADTIAITTKEVPRARILSFNAVPAMITPGETSTLTWNVENADEVTITEIGSVDTGAGSVDVSPAATTRYELTASNSVSEVTAIAIVVVSTPEPSFLRCQVTPANVVEGETATIAWETRNADSVTLSGFGNVALSGSQMINPTTSTTYTLTADNSVGSLSCPVTVQVTKGSVPRILGFAASPLEIVAGDPSALSWQVENADEVTISSIGAVDTISGVEQVTPNQNTTYTLTATNSFGSSTAAVTVRVVQPVRILSFTAQPNPVNPNEPFVLSWATENATTVSIDNNLSLRKPVGTAILQIPQTTTYTIVASNKLSTATATVEVVVTGGVPGGTPPVADAGADFTTTLQQVTLDGSGSFNPGGGSLTYEWLSLEPLQAQVLDPDQPMTRVQFLTGGVFTFQLQVTNSLGQISTDVVVVRFEGTVPEPPNTP